MVDFVLFCDHPVGILHCVSSNEEAGFSIPALGLFYLEQRCKITSGGPESDRGEAEGPYDLDET